MLFKGTPLHKNIPKVLNDKGAQFNGTTWLDRTNYYETVPASDENLEFAIRLEADRMVNSFVKGEDLASEMTVVRNEFERSENSPFRVLMQRMQSVAYEWHNYGNTTIGNRSDIERVPIANLKAFYRKHYQPDNAMLVVAGKFKEAKALDLISQYFGALKKPNRQKDNTYTEEPAQDGERIVTMRRVGEVALSGCLYKVPSGGHPDYAAVNVLSNILLTEPSGRLYKALVKTKKASSVGGMTMALHDPGVFLAISEVTSGGTIEATEKAMVEAIESISQTGVTEEEVKRAKAEIKAQRELVVNNTTGVAISLSDWAAQGDWRLFFIDRDRSETVTVEDVKRVGKYFSQSNRTVGRFVPTKSPSRIAIPTTPDLQKMLDGYKGRKEIAKGEFFDPSPANIESRTVRKALPVGIKGTFLEKKNRGEAVTLSMTLRYGNATSLKGKTIAMEMLPSIMQRGTKSMTYKDLDDAMTANTVRISGSGNRGLVQFSVQTKRKNLKNAIGILRQIVREPSFPEDQFEILRSESVAALESSISDPQALAFRALTRKMSPFPKDDIRYTPSVAEELEMTKAVTLDEIKELYQKQLSSQAGEIAIVGDFSLEEIEGELVKMLGGWNSRVKYSRVSQDANTSVKGGVESILTPDKANAVYAAGISLPIKDNADDYAALLVGNRILGGGALSSRLADRVRQKEGLSYGVGSMASAHPIDSRGAIQLYAITNPQNRDKLVSVINEELNRIVSGGVTAEEVKSAKTAMIRSRKVQRTNDGALANLLTGTSFTGRTMQYYEDVDNSIENIEVGDVNAAIKKYLKINRLSIVTAGDFKKPSDEKKEEADKK